MKELAEIQTKLLSHDKTLVCIQRSVQRIETGLFGDDPAGVEGIVKEVKKHAKYIAASKKRMAYASGFGAALLACWEWLKKSFQQ